jgi:hypothetical protein
MSTATEYTPVPTNDAVSPTAVYEDKFCRIFADKLEIKGYFFPVVGSKTISLKDIKSVRTGSQMNLEWYDTKHWGVALNNIFWACDMSKLIRTTTDCLIVEVGDDYFLKGFSCENIATVKKLLTAHLTTWR